jgi:Lar family restriction alleviation protein
MIIIIHEQSPKSRSLSTQKKLQSHACCEKIVTITDTLSKEILMPHPNLKPCPFCGCNHLLVYGNAFVKQVYCSSCETKGPKRPNELDALRAWNNRIKVKAEAEKV